MLLTVVEEVESPLLFTSNIPVALAGVHHLVFFFFFDLFFFGYIGWGWRVKEEKRLDKEIKLCCVSKLLIKDEFFVLFWC